ncbi:MAG: HAMP domain-containing protein, partial [Ignavibacteria bacterium]|nr:HAMP domain-containing protein [Ignavibacteria bacterium]
MIKTIRGQLTFYFMLILGLILCVFSIVLYNIFANQSLNEIDTAMLVLAGSLKNEITSEGIQQDIFDEVRETYIPFSIPKMQIVEILNDSGKSILKSQSELNNITSIEKEWIRESLKGKHFFNNAEIYLKDEKSSYSEFRVLIYPIDKNSKKFVLIVGVPLTNLENTLSKFRIILFIFIPIFLILSSVFGWIFSKRAYAPVSEIIKNAETITVSNLEKRLPESNSGDEISDLTKTLNGMISRLQISFQTLKQFTSDASHELRTPLTILKGEIEVALQKQRSAIEYENILKNNLEETERLQKIVDGLLILSQTESGKSNIYKKEIILSEILIEA